MSSFRRSINTYMVRLSAVVWQVQLEGRSWHKNRSICDGKTIGCLNKTKTWLAKLTVLVQWSIGYKTNPFQKNVLKVNMTSSPNLPVGLSHSCRTLAHCLHKPSLLPLIFDLLLSTYSDLMNLDGPLTNSLFALGCRHCTSVYSAVLQTGSHWEPNQAFRAAFAFLKLPLFGYFTFSQKLAHDLPFALLIASVFFKVLPLCSLSIFDWRVSFSFHSLVNSVNVAENHRT